METSCAINSIPLLLPKHWFSYDDVDAFEKKIRTFEKRCEIGAAQSLAIRIDGVEIEDKDENKKLDDRVKDLEERIAKLEKIDSKFQLTANRVKLLYMDGQQMGVGNVMSVNPKKIVMGRPIG
ncbi:hypothetical protein Taro_052016, partial [Colocasia esculenta]|nr:hypothetical protein [Colocasia esculenta]